MPLTRLHALLQKKFGGVVGRQMVDAVVCDTFDALAKERWGGTANQFVRAAYVRNQRLFVLVAHSRHAYDIQTHEAEILAGIEFKAGVKIKGIIFRITDRIQNEDDVQMG